MKKLVGLILAFTLCTGFVSSPGGSDEFVEVSMQVSSGTWGAAAVVTTWTARPLNTLTNPNSYTWVSLATNQLTLAAGDYYITGWAAFNQVNKAKLIAYDTTGTADLVLGHSSMKPAAIANFEGAANLDGRFTLSTESVVEIQYYVTNNPGTGALGIITASGKDEIYAHFKITKF